MIHLVLLLFLLKNAFCYNNTLYEAEWKHFKDTHKVSYRTESHEEERKLIFQENLLKIYNHNLMYERGLKPFKLGVTPFADLTPEEFKRMLTLRKGQLPRSPRTLFQWSNDTEEIPVFVDWRQKGAVTDVKDQGYCGSCWAFSAIGSLESQYFLKSGRLEAFSEQQLIDCATEEKYEGEGCYGGLLESGFKYMRDYSIEKESSYPYQMVNGRCHLNQTLKVTKIQDYVNVEANNEEALRAAVALIGPVSVAFDAAQFDMQFYKEGIYESTSCSQTDNNHAVLIVGYGTGKGNDYWIVKNSWGRHFGIEGYMYMKRGVNHCGIASEPMYPLL